MRDVEYSLPIIIRAGLCINLAPGEPITRQHFDDAMDAFNLAWADAAIVAGNGQVFADVLGPLNGDWRGEVYDRNAADGAEGAFDLRTDAERTAGEMHPIEDWQHEVANGDTVLGYLEWLMHRVEADESWYFIGSSHFFFTTSSEDHVERNGSICVVVRPLTTEEADAEVGPMFKVRFEDGAEIDVFIDELHEEAV